MASPHPYKNAFQCHKYSEGSPCLCPAWLEVVQQSAGNEPGAVISTVTKGCFYQLFPWLISGAIRQNNIATAEATAVRQDVHSLESRVEGLRSQVDERLQDVATGLRSLGSITGRMVLFGPPSTYNAEALRIENPAGRLIDSTSVEQIAGEVSTESD